MGLPQVTVRSVTGIPLGGSGSLRWLEEIGQPPGLSVGLTL